MNSPDKWTSGKYEGDERDEATAEQSSSAEAFIVRLINGDEHALSMTHLERDAIDKIGDPAHYVKKLPAYQIRALAIKENILINQEETNE